MTHSQLQESLAVYRDLRGADRAEVDRHVAGCAECAARLAAYRGIDRNLSGLRDARPDNRLREGFYAGLDAGRATPSARRARRPLAVAASLAAVVLAVVILGAVATWQGWLAGSQPTAGRPVGGAAPAPHSALIGSFVWQTDGAYGYQMLRPADWESMDLGQARNYQPAGGRDPAASLLLAVVNYQARFGNAAPTDSTVPAQWIAFQQNPALAGWSAALQQHWASTGAPLELVASLSDANIYTMVTPGRQAEVRTLLAFKIDNGQPLGILLQGTGPYADLSRLKAEGLVGDLITMVESARAIPLDAQNVTPALPGLESSPYPPATEPTAPTPEPFAPAPVQPAIGPESTRDPETTQVTLDIFSGLPDPAWTLSTERAQALRDRLGALPEMPCQPMNLQLGYRGFVVLLGQRPELSNEYRVRVYAGQVRWGDPWTAQPPAAFCRSDPGRQIERLLLASGQDRLSAQIYTQVAAQIEGSATTPTPTAHP